MHGINLFVDGGLGLGTNISELQEGAVLERPAGPCLVGPIVNNDGGSLLLLEHGSQLLVGIFGRDGLVFVEALQIKY